MSGVVVGARRTGVCVVVGAVAGVDLIVWEEEAMLDVGRTDEIGVDDETRKDVAATDVLLLVFTAEETPYADISKGPLLHQDGLTDSALTKTSFNPSPACWDVFPDT